MRPLSGFILTLVILSPSPILVRAAQSPAVQNALPAVEKDIPYAEGGDQQKLDLYLPAEKGFTTIVFTYGGGWHAGSRKSVAPMAPSFRVSVTAAPS